MQQLLDDQMKRKLSKQEQLRLMAANGSSPNQQTANSASPQQRKPKFLGLFQRS